jgi:MoxR-like ATPase
VLRPIVDAQTLVGMRRSLEQIHVAADVVDYVVRLLTATREHPQITVGASPRGGLALLQLARARAVLEHRDFVIVDDVKNIAVAALAHRIGLRPELWVRRITGDDLITELLESVPTPATEPT